MITSTAAVAVAAAVTAKSHPSSKICYIVRHGQAMHNPRAEAAKAAGCTMEEFFELMRQDDVLDADLTDLGRRQAQQCHQRHFSSTITTTTTTPLSSFAESQHKQQLPVKLVVSSPLSRALETADLILPTTTAPTTSPWHNIPKVVMEEFREINGRFINGQRRSKSFLKDRFPSWNFDLLTSHEDDTWTEEMESFKAAAERGYQGLAWLLSQREEDRILLVSHGGLLRYMMSIHPCIQMTDERSSDNNHNGKSVDARFDNCELRKYRISWKDDCQYADTTCKARQRSILMAQLDN
jgi:broad specificity phosphatase PhoE